MADDSEGTINVVDNNILLYLKENMKEEWRDIARYLGLSDAAIGHIESDYKGRQTEINYQILLKSKEQKGERFTYNVLSDALRKSNRQDLVDYVEEEAAKLVRLHQQPKRSNELPGETIPKRLRPSESLHDEMLVRFIENLKKTYKRLARTIRPVPYFTLWQCVGDIFVESKLEEMEKKKFESDKERWKPVSSYYDIAMKDDAKRLLLDGDPGFGKSTLALQMAYEWSATDKDSPLRKIDVLILIRLREVRNISSIFRAIKVLLLPRECTLKEENIQDILVSPDLRLVFILDGFDEFPQTDENCDIYSIISGEMFPDAKVVVMTRPDCTPSLIGPDVKRMRLTGFDESMQDAYIRKAVFPSDTDGTDAEKLIKVFRENDLLADICQVPLFFVLFAYLVKDQPELEKHQSITAYYSYMVKCFFSHMMNKEKSHLKKNKSIKEDPSLRLKLGKIGYDGLANENQNLIWSKDNVVDKLGEEGYGRYKNAGIILEEEVFNDRAVQGQHWYDDIEYETTVKFFHKTVQEFYAAVHLVQLLVKGDIEGRQYLRGLHPRNVQYLFLFACGLNDKIAGVVINHLNGLDNEQGKETALLCLLEVGDLKEYTEAITKLSKNDVSISQNQTKLLQRANVNLVQNASRYKIETNMVNLLNCFGTVDISSGNLKTKNGLTLPPLRSVKIFKIEDEGREWGEDEFREIIKYASKCDGLKTICFSRCLIPFQFPQERFVLDLLTKGVTVHWNAPYTECPTYKMNLRSFTWERQAFPFYHPELHGRLLLQEEYNSLKAVFRSQYRDTDWQKAHIPLEDTPTALCTTPTGSFRMPIVFMNF